jgi:hypothetical protein|tara:strand:+ start:172 stop:315 length:144 start_codon:yes stop_codon:yes gene_type:complete
MSTLKSLNEIKEIDEDANEHHHHHHHEKMTFKGIGNKVLSKSRAKKH